MRYSAIHNSAYVTYQLHSAPGAQKVEPCIVGCWCFCLLAWLVDCTYVVSKVVFTGAAVCTYIVCKLVSHWCSLHARWCNVSCQLQRLLERSLSSSSFSSPPLPILSLQADQDWCEGQWIHLSVVFVCVYNDHWNCWSEKCKKRNAWLQAIQVGGDKTHHLYLYLHRICSSFVFLLAHIFSYLYLCVCRDNIPHRE